MQIRRNTDNSVRLTLMWRTGLTATGDSDLISLTRNKRNFLSIKYSSFMLSSSYDNADPQNQQREITRLKNGIQSGNDSFSCSLKLLPFSLILHSIYSLFPYKAAIDDGRQPTKPNEQPSKIASCKFTRIVIVDTANSSSILRYRFAQVSQNLIEVLGGY